MRGMKYNRFDVYKVLDTCVNEGMWNLVVYEDSMEIINRELPDHEFTDEELEDYTYEWLEKNNEEV